MSKCGERGTQCECVKDPECGYCTLTFQCVPITRHSEDCRHGCFQTGAYACRGDFGARPALASLVLIGCLLFPCCLAGCVAAAWPGRSRPFGPTGGRLWPHWELAGAVGSIPDVGVALEVMQAGRAVRGLPSVPAAKEAALGVLNARLRVLSLVLLAAALAGLVVSARIEAQAGPVVLGLAAALVGARAVGAALPLFPHMPFLSAATTNAWCWVLQVAALVTLFARPETLANRGNCASELGVSLLVLCLAAPLPVMFR